MTLAPLHIAKFQGGDVFSKRMSSASGGLVVAAVGCV